MQCLMHIQQPPEIITPIITCEKSLTAAVSAHIEDVWIN